MNLLSTVHKNRVNHKFYLVINEFDEKYQNNKAHCNNKVCSGKY